MMENNQIGNIVLFLYPIPNTRRLPSDLNKNAGFVNCIIKKIQTKQIIEINVMFSFINSLDDIYKLIIYFFFMIIA